MHGVPKSRTQLRDFTSLQEAIVALGGERYIKLSMIEAGNHLCKLVCYGSNCILTGERTRKLIGRPGAGQAAPELGLSLEREKAKTKARGQ